MGERGGAAKEGLERSDNPTERHAFPQIEYLALAIIMASSTASASECTDEFANIESSAQLSKQTMKHSTDSNSILMRQCYFSEISRMMNRPTQPSTKESSTKESSTEESPAQEPLDGVPLAVVLMSPNAKVPTYGSSRAAGLDLYTSEECEIYPGKYTKVHTGIGATAPPGHYLRIAPRSGLTATCYFDVGAGVVDEDYTGEICVLLTARGINKYGNLPDGISLICVEGSHDGMDVIGYRVDAGIRIAQMVVEKCQRCDVIVVDKLSTEGPVHAGFGSTGTQ